MPTGYTAVSGSALKDASDNPITNATICFQPVTSKGAPTSFMAGGGGQTIVKPVTAQVTNGAFTIQLADTTLTTPVNVGYAVSVTDNLTGDKLLGPGYGCVQPSGATWNWDTYAPNLAPNVTIQNGPQGIQGNPGSNGVQSLPEIASMRVLAQSATKNVLSNLGWSSPGYINYTTGVYASGAAGWISSPFVVANSGGQMTLSSPIDSVANNGLAFYDQNFAYISGLPGASVTAYTAFSVPSNAAYLRLSVQIADNIQPTLMLFNGSVSSGSAPASYISAEFAPQSTTTAAITASAAAVTASVNTALASSSSVITAQTAAKLPLYQNLADPARFTASEATHPGTGTGTAVPTLVTGTTGYTLSGFIPVSGAAYVCSNKALYTNAGYGPVFADATQTYLPTGVGTPLTAFNVAGVGIPANTCIAVPANAAYFQAFLNVSAGNTGNNGVQDISTWMITTSPTSTPVFPSSYQPFIGSTATIDATARALAQPLHGVQVGWLGDSISWGEGSGLALSPLVAAITGAVNAYSLSWPGRAMYDALDNTGQTGVAFPTQTIIQSLQVLVLWLGTNINTTIGSSTDTASIGTTNANGITFPSTDSYCAQLKGVLNQLLAWNPSLRIIKASPYQSNNQNASTGGTGGAGQLPTPAGLALLKAVYTADLAVAGDQYGIPVLNLFDEMGICNANNSTLLVDGTHPTAATQQTRIAPYFAHKMAAYAPQ